MGILNELFSAGVWGEKIPTVPKWKKMDTSQFE